MRNHDYAKARNPLTTRGTFDGETKGRSDGQTATHQHCEPCEKTLRQVRFSRRERTDSRKWEKSQK